MESGTANLLHMLQERVKKLCDEGNWEEARHAAEASLEKARAALSHDDESILALASSLEVKGDFLRRYGHLEDARQCYLESLELLQGRSDCREQLARISASTAVVYETDGNEEEAIRFYERAVALFEEIDPPAYSDLADLYNNLAYIYKCQNNFEMSENLYLRALKICHEIYGQKDEETAAVCNNVGALYLAAGYLEQAREMHIVALEARQETLGEKHLETAQSHANLALVLAQMSDNKAAHKHFDSAMSIFERNIREAPMDYATVAANYVEFLHLINEEKRAQAVEKRSSKMLNKVNMATA